MLKKYGIFLLISAFLVVKVISFSYAEIRWDPAVYMGMAKYIYSAGEAGFFEPARPLLWPMLIGFFWKLNVDFIFFSKLAMLFFSSACIFLTYLLGKEIFDEKVGLFAAFLLMITGTFLYFSSTLFTEIPSTFFALMAIYFFVKNKYALTGIFFGLAFLTRFFQIFTLIFVLLFLIYRKRIVHLYSITGMFLITILPYLIFNLWVYKNPVYPFLLQIYMATQLGFPFYQPWHFYIVGLFRENFIYMTAVLAFLFIKKDGRRDSQFFIMLLPVFLFTLYSIAAHKEMRFAITFLPYLYISASFSLLEILRKIKFKHVILSLIILFLLFQWWPMAGKEEAEYAVFKEYLAKGIKGSVWITNPVFAMHYNKKIAELMYYPAFNKEKAEYLKSNINKANHILLNSCDLYCEPDFKECEKEKEGLVQLFKDNFMIVWEGHEGPCQYIIFRK